MCCEAMFTRTMLIIYLFLWLISGGTQARSLNFPSDQRTSTTGQIITSRKADIASAFTFDDQFEWRGPWTLNEKYMVMAASVGAIDMLLTTMKLLTGAISDGLPQGEQDPSFSRYFRPGDMWRFRSAIESQLGFLGCPGFSNQRSCIADFKKVILYRGDGPIDEGSGLGCFNERAYVNHFNEGSSGASIRRDFISFCDLFFQEFKAHIHSKTLPTVPYVDPAKLYPYIDEMTPHNFQALSGAADLIHELFHIDWIYAPAIQYQILDLHMTRPDNGQDVQGYRGFYAMKVKDPTWNPRVSQDRNSLKVTDPLYNVDSYVMCVLEIFYRVTYKMKPWIDSPDPHSFVPWP